MLIYLSEEHGDKSTQIKSWDQEKTSVSLREMSHMPEKGGVRNSEECIRGWTADISALSEEKNQLTGS